MARILTAKPHSADVKRCLVLITYLRHLCVQVWTFQLKMPTCSYIITCLLRLYTKTFGFEVAFEAPQAEAIKESKKTTS